MTEKIVCFAGHRSKFQCQGITKKLYETIENLIERGYTVFYDGARGAFDKMALEATLHLKKKYPHIKIYTILADYRPNLEPIPPSSGIDGTIFPELELTHFKSKITKRNQWIIDTSDILVCHIETDENSGAFKTVKYARSQSKPIIYI